MSLRSRCPSGAISPSSFRSSPERLSLITDRARIVALQILLAPLRHRVTILGRIRIALHPVKWQFTDGFRARRINVHILAEAVGVNQKRALPSFRQSRQTARVEINPHLVAAAG